MAAPANHGRLSIGEGEPLEITEWDPVTSNLARAERLQRVEATIYNDSVGLRLHYRGRAPFMKQQVVRISDYIPSETPWDGVGDDMRIRLMRHGILRIDHIQHTVPTGNREITSVVSGPAEMERIPGSQGRVNLERHAETVAAHSFSHNAMPGMNIHRPKPEPRQADPKVAVPFEPPKRQIDLED